MAEKADLWRPNFVSVEGGPEGSGATSFRIISYNILAQAYVKSANFPNSPSSCLKWKARSKAVLSRLLAFDADFLCLQELDEYESYYKPNMSREGYESVYVKRSGRKRDGCGIFFRRSRFALLDKQAIDYNRLVPPDGGQEESSGSEGEDEPVDGNDPRVRLKRDCVGIMAAFRFLDGPQHLLLLTNTHLYWDPAWADVKLAQAKYLLLCLSDYQRTLSEKFNSAPVILVTGDFNSQPEDRVYVFLLSGHASGDDKPAQVSNEQSDSDERPPVQLCSLYAQVGREPAFTNVSTGFTGTLDYILFRPCEALKPKSYLAVPESEDAPELEGGLPNYNHPSDHLPIGADFSITA